MTSNRVINGLIYLIIISIYSAFIFVTLLPEVKNRLYTKCVWKLDFVLCNKFFGIEAGYRLTLILFTFYGSLSILTFNCRGSPLLWYCQDSCFVKMVALIASNLFGFMIPFSRALMEGLYRLFLISTAVFLFIMFFTMLDCAHAFRMLWLEKARKSADEPTCYLCTWLFLIHLTTAFLYAISLDFIMAFFFFNRIEDCVSTIAFVAINVCLCLMCFSLSYFPNLRRREASSQIIFASLLCIVVYVTWLALSDPENRDCNMYGTIFTGTILESSTSFRSLISLTLSVPVFLYQSFKQVDANSFIISLLVENVNLDCLRCFENLVLHVTMATGSAFVLMSVTNIYEPVYSVLETPGVSQIKSPVIYFEGYDRFRFMLLCSLSVLLPVCYLSILLWRIGVSHYTQWRRARDERNRVNSEKESDDEENKDNRTASTMEGNEFVYIRIIFAEATRRLKSALRKEILTTPYDQTAHTLQYMLLPCFSVKDYGLSYWHFPRHLSQTYFKGRNGSNACTIISVIIGRYFSRSNLPYQTQGYLGNEWLNLFYTSIEDGSQYYDTLVKELGVLDLSVEEVEERLGGSLNIACVHPSLPVSFDAEIETVTIYYQLRLLLLEAKKTVCLFIHKKRTASFLIYETGEIIYADSHAFGENGALMVSADIETLPNLLDFLKFILGNAENRLATLTVIQYETRRAVKEKAFDDPNDFI